MNDAGAASPPAALVTGASSGIGYRECVDLLEAAARERGHALVVNTSSISGKHGQAQFGAYSGSLPR